MTNDDSRTREPKRKPYRSPQLAEQTTPEPTMLLICTGAYNCIDEVGYDCCQPDNSTCFSQC